MKTDRAQLDALEKKLAELDGADMHPLPVEFLRGLAADARAQQQYEQRVDDAFERMTAIAEEFV